MQPQSLAHHQLDSQPRQRDRLCCPVPATSGQLHNVLRTRDARLNQGTLPLRWARADSTCTPLLLEKGRDSRVVAAGSQRAQAQWKTIGDNGMCLGNKDLVHMLSLHLAFSFHARSLSLSISRSTSEAFVLHRALQKFELKASQSWRSLSKHN